MSLNAYLSELIELEATLAKKIEKIVYDNQDKLVRMIRERLYQHGIGGDGQLITPTYARQTIEAKKEKKQRVSHVTLRDTGAFYEGMFIEVKNNILSANSLDGKTPSLIEKYGASILEFTEEEQTVIIFGIIEPEIQKILNKLNSKNIDILK
jgi:hypothetical protein